MKTFKQLREDASAVAANTTTNALPDKEAVVSKSAQIRYKKKNADLNTAGRKIASTM